LHLKLFFSIAPQHLPTLPHPFRDFREAELLAFQLFPDFVGKYHIGRGRSFRGMFIGLRHHTW
jgi:hypothetical protein